MNSLLKSYLNGNNSALEELMLVSYKDLFKLAYSYLKDKMLAEDAVSEVFLKLIEKAPEIKSDRNLSGYLKTMIINKSFDITRKRKQDFFAGDELIKQVAVKVNPNNKDEYTRFILFALNTKEREILLLWFYGYTLNEIVEKTGLTINQVRLLLEKAKNNFSLKYHKYRAD